MWFHSNDSYPVSNFYNDLHEKYSNHIVFNMLKIMTTITSFVKTLDTLVITTWINFVLILLYAAW